MFFIIYLRILFRLVCGKIIYTNKESNTAVTQKKLEDLKLNIDY